MWLCWVFTCELHRVVMLGLYMCDPSCGYVGSLHVSFIVWLCWVFTCVLHRVVMLDLYM